MVEQLAAELGASRVPINKAISLLRTAGLVRVRRGSGTYVRTTRDARYRYANPRAVRRRRLYAADEPTRLADSYLP